MPAQKTELRHQEIQTEKGVLRYLDYGEGPPLLFLHGSGPGVTGLRNFGDNLPVFGEHFRCLVLELPGFGVSDPTDEHPIAGASGAVLRFLDAKELGPVAVIGNSMGGAVATELAMLHQHLFTRIVTIGGVGRSLLNPLPGEGIRLLSAFVEHPTREALISWLEAMVFDPAIITDELIEERWRQAVEPSTLEATRRMYGRDALATLFPLQPTADRPASWSMLHTISCPVLITWGRDDRVSPLDMALLPMRLIPSAQLLVLPNCGHWVMIEQKDAWERAVLAYLGAS